MLKSSEYVGLLVVILEALTLIIVAATVHGYRKMSIDLRSVDLAVLIIAELLFGFSEFMMYVYKQPFYMYVIAGISFVLILYILLFVKAKIKERVTFAALPLVMLVAAGFLSINTSIFTVRYVYLSSDGYYNDVSNNDMAHFYYTESVNVTNFSKLPSYGTKGIYSMSEYENFCNSYKGSVNMSELLNFSRNYSDGFLTAIAFMLLLLSLNRRQTESALGDLAMQSVRRFRVFNIRNQRTAINQRAFVLCLLKYL